MPYPVAPPEPPSVVYQVPQQQVAPPALNRETGNTPEVPHGVGAVPPCPPHCPAAPPQVREVPRLRSSGLPELQRRSRADALLSEPTAGWTQPTVEFSAPAQPQLAVSPANNLFPQPPAIVAADVSQLSPGSVEIRIFERPPSETLPNREPNPEFLGIYRLPLLQSSAIAQVQSRDAAARQLLKKNLFYTSPARSPGTAVGALREAPPPPAGAAPAPMPPLVPEDVVELTADRQEYDEQRQILTAEGNVLMRYRNSVLDADRVQVNLQSRAVVAQGNVAWTRGEQVLRGQRMEYNFVQGVGTVKSASGELYLPTSGTDFAPTLPTDVSATALLEQPLSDRVTANQPLENVASPPGGVAVTVGTGYNQTGELRRVRYEAEQVDFTPEGGIARNIRFTNDPFSPPELELRAPEAKLTRLSPFQDEIRATNPRLVFDQGFSLPFYPNRVVIDRREREPGLFRFGYDRRERGGLFVESPLEPISNQRLRLRVTPQFYIQRAIEKGFSNIGDLFGLKVRLNANLGPRTTAAASASFQTLDLSKAEDEMRASLRVNQGIPTPIGIHTLTGEYSYRDRLFNGSLGYQTVQRSIGAVLTSPVIPLGKTGINLSYQAGFQQVEADSDRLDLLDPIRDNNRIDLSRFQASAALSRGIRLWRGEPLPATPTEGLRYTPNPVVPYLQLLLGLRGVTSSYSSGDNQSSLTGSVGLLGQFGHFSRQWFDYTAFNVTYTQVFQDGLSPFLFDRVADVRVLGAGITQQIYGPFRVGLQTAINLDSGQEINTDYIIEYSRRTYGIVLRYNPVREIGSLTLRISDFNWNGTGEPFSGTDVRTVEGGVRRD